MAAASAWAQTVAIGSAVVPVVSPATSSYYYGPLYRSSATSTFNFSRYAHLYTPADLGLAPGSVITQLAWLKSDAGEVTGSNTFTVWLENSTVSSLGTTQTWSAVSATATQVYTSAAQTVTGAAGTYFSVTLSQPFVYTGGNLLLLTDWVQTGTATGAVNFVTNEATGYAVGYANSTALTPTTSLTASSYGNRRPTLRVTYTPGAACTAPPTAGTVRASSTSVCSGTPVSFTLPGASYGAGMSYQWQSSTNGTTFTDITGATGPVYNAATLMATTWVRAVLTCSGQSATTPAVQVTVSAPTYATLPVATSFETAWVDGCGTHDIPSGNWRNAPGTGNNSWRRDDEGATANWTSATSYMYTPAASQGARSARFHSGYASSGTIGTLDLFVNLSAAGNKILSFDYINTTGADSLTIQLSTDGGQTFGPALLRLNQAATWTPKYVSISSSSATAVIRFRARSDFGTTDIGLDNLNLEVLTGVPNCATNFSPANNATGVIRPVTLTWANGGGVATGYDVYFGTAATPPLVSSNQTGTSYTPAGTLLPNTTYYYQIVPRNPNGAATGCVVNQFTTSSMPIYCTASLGGFCGSGNANISAVAIANTTLNNPNTTCNTVNGNSYVQWPASGSTTAVLNPGVTYQLSVTTPESGIISVWVDFNQNGTFEASEWTQVATASTGGQPATVAIVVPTGAVAGQTAMRVRSRSYNNPNGAADACTNFGSGETEDYIVTIAPAAPCTAPPTAGTATASTTSICAPLPVTLGLQGASFGSGMSYQWQSSINGTTYTDIAGATSSTYTTAPVTATTWFRAVLTCSGQSATATAVQVVVNGPSYATLPVIENFEAAWVNACATRDAPSNSWRMTPSATDADASWRRDDDGAGGGWASPASGAYTPISSQGSRSARFHTYNASSGTVGTLDLFADLSAAGNKRLTFDFINTSGLDSLTIQLSTNGGQTFSTLLRLNQAATWTNQALPITSTSATTVIRFRGRSDFGVTDIGLDNVRLESATGCLSPAGLTVSATTSTTATLSWVSGGTGTHTVEYGPIGFTLGQGTQVTGITGSSTTLTGLTPGTPYQFYVTQNCGSTASPAGGPLVFNTQITNDDPAGAIALTVNNTCTPVSGTNVGATTTTANGYTNAGGCGSGTSPKDVWYKFTTAATGPTSTAVRITVTGTPASQLRAFSAASAAGPFTSIGCAATSSTVAAPNLDLNNLTPSTTYYVRVSGYASADAQGAFAICAQLLPNCQAPVLPAAASVSGSTATLTWGGVQGTGATYIVEYGVQGFTQGQGTIISGISSQTATLTGLTASTNYCFYVRQNCGGVNGQSAWSSSACFSTGVAAASNDEPCTAIPALVTAQGQQGQLLNIAGTTLGATTSTGGGLAALLPACSPSLSPKDVWFTVTLPPNVTSLSAVIPSPTVGMVRLFTADNCSTAFTQVDCRASAGANQAVGGFSFTGLTAGRTYYLAMSGYGTNDTQGPFSAQVLAMRNELAGGRVDIFPNPVAGGSELNVRISGAKPGAVQCEVLNALGQVVLTRHATMRNGALEQRLTTTGLARGLYQVRLTLGTETLVRKVVVE
ncbi:GEVED domain-containing protein [Hymenobacter sp. CRA2]|uniref:GEVED domain-containing protein n=1 Tax=Hymenobacter sp. CRA2 TaxID=1955620 RepID=UPI0009C5897C|nr:GEVED domain-containing protein [Hymenobacter sp. CRA2]OON70500.1 hypothetical protein B0919_00250 [Hymenobacter sp. CRA2]